METQQPFEINLTKESLIHRNEEFWFEGDKVENNIVLGKETMIEEKDREWLKELVEGTGVDLSKVEGDLNLKQQARNLSEVLGLERANKYIKGVVVELLKAPKGDVSDGEIKPEEVDTFVEKYLNGEVKVKTEWQEKVFFRISAVVAVSSKLMWILGAENEEEAGRRQNTPGVLKHLRERVMRGYERCGEAIEGNNARYANSKGEDGVVRYLPKSGVGTVLAHLTTLD